MADLTRRTFLQVAIAIGATAAWGARRPARSRIAWREQQDAFPEGVASGDPDSNSVVLWTRSPCSRRTTLHVEVAEDDAFERVVVATTAVVSAESDWTCRVLAGRLKPSSVYWYRFTHADGRGSRIGRTITAPADDDARPVRFAFVSCQNANAGANNAYRRMIFADERAPEHERLTFVLHLGDFIYEVVWYPEDRPQGMYDRRLRDIVRYPTGEKIRDFHIPVTLDDYRAVYRAYLHDPDLQDARARWPFVSMWDNHEFSWLGWQSIQKFGKDVRPAQTLKVAANQAFFEFQPGRMVQAHGLAFDRFRSRPVQNKPITRFDDDGLGLEPNNLAAISSLRGYRALRFGKNVELIITDQHSYRSEEPTGRAEAQPLNSDDFPEMVPEEAMRILDAGRSYDGGKPPARIRFGEVDIANLSLDRPPQTILGAEQKSWFLQRLEKSRATWKIWGSTEATLEMRADPQNLPEGLTRRWPGTGYASFGGGGEPSTAYVERAEIYDFVHSNGITGFATVAGDRHSFWAGLSAKSLPPESFVPMGIAFVTGSISAPGILEALEHSLPKDHPLRALYLAKGPADAKEQPTLNLLLHRGVKSSLEYAKSGDIAKARQATNPALSPHVKFVDMGGHGYATVIATTDAMDVEFVCIPRPLERSARPDGGPLLYRARFHTPLWKTGESPVMTMRVVEGDPKFST